MSFVVGIRSRIGRVILGMAASFLTGVAGAQLIAPTQLRTPEDPRLNGVYEDWTSPGLDKSHLQTARPLIGFVDQKQNYSVQLIQVQWRHGDPIDLYVMKPNGVKKPPVVLYMFGYPSDTDIFKSLTFQNLVTKDGFAAVGFVTALTGHRYHDRPMKQWFLSELQESLAVSAHDVQMVLDYLATRGDLDLNRVGMMAQLSGGSVGILASAVDPRIQVLDVRDPWGDWPTWMATSPFVPKDERADFVKPEFLSKAALLEPAEWMPKVQAKKFRLEQRRFEKETPDASKDKLRAAVPTNASVVVYKTPEEYMEAVGTDGSKGLKWIQEELRALPGAAPEAPSKATTKVRKAPGKSAK
jgi:hypothetical protein